MKRVHKLFSISMLSVALLSYGFGPVQLSLTALSAETTSSTVTAITSEQTQPQAESEPEVTIGSRGSRLTGNDLVAYNFLKEQIERVALGDRSDTVFTVPISEFGVDTSKEFSEEELGLSGKVFTFNSVKNDFDTDEAVLAEAYQKLNEKIKVDFDKVFQSLIADCPFDLYWFNNNATWVSSGLKVRGEITSSDAKAYFSYEDDVVTCYFPVSSDYVLKDSAATADSAETDSMKAEHADCRVDTAKTIEAAKASQRALEIVKDAAGMSDYDKLYYYLVKICELAGYNEKASVLFSPANYGSMAPWQVIDVFHDAESGEGLVVCEGYSKAFKYLCDLTDFEDDGLYCVNVTGVMMGGTGSGKHTWNLIETGDGNTYLVDLTNCDEESIGEPDLLFMGSEMVLYEGSPEDGYVFTMPFGEQVYYQYSETATSLYTQEELTLGNAK